jgi:hypothetical protein
MVLNRAPFLARNQTNWSMNEPLCEKPPTLPLSAGIFSMSTMGKVDMPAAGLKKPMQFGPTILMPLSRATRAISRSMSLP